MDGPFQGLTLAIKLRGTTLEALGNHFVRTSFLILGGLSLLLGGGIFLTYRNVSKEMSTPAVMPALVQSAFQDFPGPNGGSRVIELKRND